MGQLGQAHQSGSRHADPDGSSRSRGLVLSCNGHPEQGQRQVGNSGPRWRVDSRIFGFALRRGSVVRTLRVVSFDILFFEIATRLYRTRDELASTWRTFQDWQRSGVFNNCPFGAIEILDEERIKVSLVSGNFSSEAQVVLILYFGGFGEFGPPNQPPMGLGHVVRVYVMPD